VSTYIGVKCHTCGEKTGTGCKIAYTEEVQLAIGSDRLITSLYTSTAPFEAKTTFPWDADIDIADFLVGHCGHDMRIYDEYGRDYDRHGKLEILAPPPS